MSSLWFATFLVSNGWMSQAAPSRTPTAPQPAIGAPRQGASDLAQRATLTSQLAQLLAEQRELERRLGSLRQELTDLSKKEAELKKTADTMEQKLADVRSAVQKTQNELAGLPSRIPQSTAETVIRTFELKHRQAEPVVDLLRRLALWSGRPTMTITEQGRQIQRPALIASVPAAPDLQQKIFVRGGIEAVDRVAELIEILDRPPGDPPLGLGTLRAIRLPPEQLEAVARLVEMLRIRLSRFAIDRESNTLYVDSTEPAYAEVEQLVAGVSKAREAKGSIPSRGATAATPGARSPTGNAAESWIARLRSLPAAQREAEIRKAPLSLQALIRRELVRADAAKSAAPESRALSDALADYVARLRSLPKEAQEQAIEKAPEFLRSRLREALKRWEAAGTEKKTGGRL